MLLFTKNPLLSSSFFSTEVSQDGEDFVLVFGDIKKFFMTGDRARFLASSK
jgi:hypothetical protein